MALFSNKVDYLEGQLKQKNEKEDNFMNQFNE